MRERKRERAFDGGEGGMRDGEEEGYCDEGFFYFKRLRWSLFLSCGKEEEEEDEKL